MILRVSTILGKKIGSVPSDTLPKQENPYADWSSHLFTADRVQYIITVNTASLYTVVIFGRGIRDDSDLILGFLDQLRDLLTEDGYKFVFKKFILPETGTVAISKALNRSVTGSMNDAVNQARYTLAGAEMSPYDVSKKLNDTPYSYLDYANPRTAFRALRFREQ